MNACKMCLRTYQHRLIIEVFDISHVCDDMVTVVRQLRDWAAV